MIAALANGLIVGRRRAGSAWAARTAATFGRFAKWGPQPRGRERRLPPGFEVDLFIPHCNMGPKMSRQAPHLAGLGAWTGAGTILGLGRALGFLAALKVWGPCLGGGGLWAGLTSIQSKMYWKGQLRWR